MFRNSRVPKLEKIPQILTECWMFIWEMCVGVAGGVFVWSLSCGFHSFLITSSLIKRGLLLRTVGWSSHSHSRKQHCLHTLLTRPWRVGWQNLWVRLVCGSGSWRCPGVHPWGGDGVDM